MRVLKVKLHRRRAQRKTSAPLRRVPPAAAGMRLTFRAQLMPGRAADARTFTVARVLLNGRVELYGLAGQHTLTEFEPVL